MKVIRTVCGDIKPEELGMTSMHEHTIIDIYKMKETLDKQIPDMMKGAMRYKFGVDVIGEAIRRKILKLPEVASRDVDAIINGMFAEDTEEMKALSDVDFFANELKNFKKYGGQSICDCSPVPVKIAWKDIKELSEKSGVNIIVCAGVYVKQTISDADYAAGEEQLMKKIEYVLEHGDGTCDARPGFVKCALANVESNGIAKKEWMYLRACAKTAKKHGMSLHIHVAFPLRKNMVIKIADMLENEIQINPERVLFCHMDDIGVGFNPSARINKDGYSVELALHLTDRGFNIGFDTWSVSLDTEEIAKYSIHARKAMLRELIDKKRTNYIVMGHDLFSRSKGVQNGGCGYTLWPETLKKMMDAGELSQEDYDTITVKNPARILSIDV